MPREKHKAHEQGMAELSQDSNTPKPEAQKKAINVQGKNPTVAEMQAHFDADRLRPTEVNQLRAQPAKLLKVELHPPLKKLPAIDEVKTYRLRVMLQRSSVAYSLFNQLREGKPLERDQAAWLLQNPTFAMNWNNHLETRPVFQRLAEDPAMQALLRQDPARQPAQLTPQQIAKQNLTGSGDNPYAVLQAGSQNYSGVTLQAAPQGPIDLNKSVLIDNLMAKIEKRENNLHVSNALRAILIETARELKSERLESTSDLTRARYAATAEERKEEDEATDEEYREEAYATKEDHDKKAEANKELAQQALGSIVSEEAMEELAAQQAAPPSRPGKS